MIFQDYYQFSKHFYRQFQSLFCLILYLKKKKITNKKRTHIIFFSKKKNSFLLFKIFKHFEKYKYINYFDENKYYD